MAEDTSSKKLAVLIDADNAQPSTANALLTEVARLGTTPVRRAYGDWTGINLKGWKEALLTESIQPIQQFAYTKGKNATDSAMIIDAMDLLYTNRFDGFCLVSSDSDFTRLASRIRESGVLVYGFGEHKTPKPFVSACDQFFYVENLRAVPPLPSAAPNPETPSSDRRPRTPGATNSPSKSQGAGGRPDLPADLKRELREVVARTMDDDSDGWVNLAKIGKTMNRIHPDFDTRSYGYQKFAELLAATGMFKLERRVPEVGKPVVMYARDKGGDI